jgi:hypothetical protein
VNNAILQRTILGMSGLSRGEFALLEQEGRSPDTFVALKSVVVESIPI